MSYAVPLARVPISNLGLMKWQVLLVGDVVTIWCETYEQTEPRHVCRRHSFVAMFTYGGILEVI